MAAIERRKNRFRLIFYYLGDRYTTGLKTLHVNEANAIAGSVDRVLALLQQKALEIPEGVDLVTFVLSGGWINQKQVAAPACTFATLRDGYVETHQQGAMEANSLETVKMHLRHFCATLGDAFPMTRLPYARR